MSSARNRRLVALAVSVAALALPATAGAHGSVYGSIAKAVPNPAPSPLGYGDLIDQTRYVVTNHGNSYVLRESNGHLDKGMIDYKRLPGAFRNTITTGALLTLGDSGAQPHSTCETAALETEDAITAWQEKTAPTATPPNKPEPFYRYVPFQKASAGLGDEPEEWIQLVHDLTGVDLEQVSDDPVAAVPQLKALCEGLPGGTFVEADAVQTAATAFNSATILAATNPLNVAAQAAASETQVLRNEVTRLKLEATTLKFNSLADQLVATLTGAGSKLALQGPAGKAVKVRMLVRPSAVRKLKLKSRVIAEGSANIADDATATVVVKAKGKAASALKRLSGSRKLLVEARAADRIAQSASKIKG